ncbi:MAG: hypothetical protein ACI8RD_007745, partial [Bacillariaceae sp.]|jgi:hypothetical protein
VEFPNSTCSKKNSNIQSLLQRCYSCRSSFLLISVEHSLRNPVTESVRQIENIGNPLRYQDDTANNLVRTHMADHKNKKHPSSFSQKMNFVSSFIYLILFNTYAVRRIRPKQIPGIGRYHGELPVSYFILCCDNYLYLYLRINFVHNESKN